MTRPIKWQQFLDIKSTDIIPNGPASQAGLRVGDKILQCNGYDFTIVTHKKAVEYIQRYDVLNLLVVRRDTNGVQVWETGKRIYSLPNARTDLVREKVTDQGPLGH